MKPEGQAKRTDVQTAYLQNTVIFQKSRTSAAKISKNAKTHPGG